MRSPRRNRNGAAWPRRQCEGIGRGRSRDRLIEECSPWSMRPLRDCKECRQADSAIALSTTGKSVLREALRVRLQSVYAERRDGTLSERFKTPRTRPRFVVHAVTRRVAECFRVSEARGGSMSDSAIALQRRAGSRSISGGPRSRAWRVPAPRRLSRSGGGFAARRRLRQRGQTPWTDPSKRPSSPTIVGPGVVQGPRESTIDSDLAQPRKAGATTEWVVALAGSCAPSSREPVVTPARRKHGIARPQTASILVQALPDGAPGRRPPSIRCTSFPRSHVQNGAAAIAPFGEIQPNPRMPDQGLRRQCVVGHARDVRHLANPVRTRVPPCAGSSRSFLMRSTAPATSIGRRWCRRNFPPAMVVTGWPVATGRRGS